MHLSTHNWMRAEPLAKTLARIKKYGYESIEISGEPTQYDVKETRKLLKEVQRAHDLADQAEASRIENLHRLISTEFRLLNDRLGAIVAVAEPVSGPANEDPEGEGRPLSLTELVTRGEPSRESNPHFVREPSRSSQ